MMPPHSLTAHFEQAVRNIRAVMPSMNKKELAARGFDIKSVPRLETQPWNDRRHDSNCYDFALNRPGRFRIPGDLSRERGSKQPADQSLINSALEGEDIDLFEFATQIHEGLRRDGLIELGDAPELSARGTLVALFMGDESDLEEAGRQHHNGPDIHFYALRRDGKKLVWAHKEGEKEVAVLGPDPAAPFADAPRHGDRLFAGFWLVPKR